MRPGPFVCAGLTDIGNQRPENQDTFAILRSAGLFLVCDGMGGHNDGAAAATMACQTIASVIQEAPRRTGDAAVKLLRGAIETANTAVGTLGRGKLRPGTTVAALLYTGQEVVLGHAGDSRIYRLRRGVLEQRTRDHSLANQLVDEKRLRLEDVAAFPHKNIITKALGTKAKVDPDVLLETLYPGDVFLLCSDGVDLDPRKLRRCLTLAPSDAVEAIKARTLEGDAPDNLTAVVVRFRGGVA